MLKSVIITLAASMAAFGATTSVQDTLYQADGVTKFNGVLRVSWGTFQSADGQQHPAGSLISNVRLGALNQALEPNDTATPMGTYYTVNYQLSNGTNMFECWVVPTSGTPVNLTVVRVSPSVCGTSFPSIGSIPVSSLAPGVPWSFLQTNGVSIPTWETLPVIAGLGQHGIPVIEGTSPISAVLPSGTDVVLRWVSTSVDPTTTALPNCGDATHALSYSTGTHAFGCQGLSGGGGSSPSGSDQSVQYNLTGSFGGDTNLLWDYTNHRLSVGGNQGGTGYGNILVYSNNAASFAELNVINDASAANNWALIQAYDLHGGNTANNGPTFRGATSRGTASSPAATQSGDALMHLQGLGYGTFYQIAAAIDMIASSTWTGSNLESNMLFSTTPNGSAIITVGMDLNSSQHLLIGTTTDTGSGAKLQVAGMIQLAATSQPACTSSTPRFLIWAGIIGGVDTVAICTFNGTTYGWRQIVP